MLPTRGVLGGRGRVPSGLLRGMGMPGGVGGDLGGGGLDVGGGREGGREGGRKGRGKGLTRHAPLRLASLLGIRARGRCRLASTRGVCGGF